MGGQTSIYDRSPFQSITEKYAFPYERANETHKRIKLDIYNGIYYKKLYPTYMEDEDRFPTMIFCHGNGSTVSYHYVNKFQKISDRLGMIIYMIEYPKYGEAYKLPGYPTAKKCVKNLSYLVDFILSQKESDYYCLCGYSIGTGIILEYMKHTNKLAIDSIILIAPYKSIAEVVLDDGGLFSSLFNFYYSEDNIKNIIRDICIIHGNDDEVIDISHADTLYESINDSCYKRYFILEKINHVNITDCPECWDCVEEFIYGTDNGSDSDNTS